MSGLHIAGANPGAVDDAAYQLDDLQNDMLSQIQQEQRRRDAGMIA
jgi:hypothetical protein